jgi:peptide/nickel transport system ATP-binding protein
MPRCTTEPPPRLEVGDRPGHWAACWLHDPTTRAEQASPAALAAVGGGDETREGDR